MRYLIVSDLHANREALEAVAREAEDRYDSILCCGDLVGYGADPNAAVEWARARCDRVVRGNHDKAAAGLEDLSWFNPVARTAAEWTARQLTPENLAYLRALPRGPLPVEDFELAHGSPADEDEYLSWADQAFTAFDYMESRVTFFGHTHLQGGFRKTLANVEPIPRPPAALDRVMLDLRPGSVYLINPGSVGQPRDGDPRAAFAIYDSGAGIVTYWRVPYDVAGAQRKIRDAGLPDVLASRLQNGR